MTITALTAFPPAPDRSSPDTFADLSDAWVTHMEVVYYTEAQQMITEINAATATMTSQVGTATTQAGIATTQAGIATTQAGIATTNGAAQVALAAGQVALATTQAGIATTQAGIATTQAGLATTNGAAQVALATIQASNAAQSAIDAAAFLDQFDDKYLGAKSSDPTLDNDGSPLVAGAIYINTTTGFIRCYMGGGVWVQGLSTIAGVSSLNGQQGDLTFTYADVDATPISHVGSGGSQHANATTSTSGFMPSSAVIFQNNVTALFSSEMGII